MPGNLYLVSQRQQLASEQMNVLPLPKERLSRWEVVIERTARWCWTLGPARLRLGADADAADAEAEADAADIIFSKLQAGIPKYLRVLLWTFLQ